MLNGTELCSAFKLIRRWRGAGRTAWVGGRPKLCVDVVCVVWDPKACGTNCDGMVLGMCVAAVAVDGDVVGR